MSDVGRWRRIYSNEWHAGAFQGLSDSERVVYFYSRTGPQSTSVGVYRISTAVAVEDIGNLTAVEFDHRLSVVCEAFDWRFDVATRVLWIPTWLDENPPQSPNVCKSWRKLIANLPDCDLKFEAAAAIVRQLKDWGEDWRKAFGEAFQKPKAQPKAKARADQGSGIRDQRSGEKRTGVLRAVAKSEGDDPKLQIARLTVRQFDEHMGIDQLVDHFHHLRTQKRNGHGTDDWKRADIEVALNAAIAEKRGSSGRLHSATQSGER